MQSTILSFLSLTAILATAWTPSPITTVVKGFNYASNVDFPTEFHTAKNLVGTNGFASARLYTMIADKTTNDPIPALQAAMDTQTTLLLGLYCSAGQAAFDNEKIALQKALQQYPSVFSNLVVGISVGSEDIYRTSVFGTPQANGQGDTVTNLQSYIQQTKDILTAAKLSKPIPVGHVDTWQMWVDPTLAGALIPSIDFIGVDAYPYWQSVAASDSGAFMDGFNAVKSTAFRANNIPVWATETGWPNSGATRGAAVANYANAGVYWKGVGCGNLFDKVNTWWYTLQDGPATALAPSFGIIDQPANTTALFDLSCAAGGKKR